MSDEGRVTSYRNTMRLYTLPILWLLLAPMVSALAESADSINSILSATTPPDGVVFEIVTGDEDGLEWAIPRTQEYIRQLRKKFPDLSIAVVTHGQEMFAMQEREAESSRQVHQTVKSLIQDQDVQVSVCGAYAGWRGLADEDFPDYVDVTASGPAQINDYVALGYTKIVITYDD